MAKKLPIGLGFHYPQNYYFLSFLLVIVFLIFLIFGQIMFYGIFWTIL